VLLDLLGKGEVLGFYVITKQAMRTNQKHNKPPSQYLKSYLSIGL